MKHTTIEYDPVFGAKTVTVDVPETSLSLKQEQALKSAIQTREAIAKKQRANNGHHK
ncbi:MAG: hypothetical protein MJ165_03435 [Alphaproteobacteria bacterium]|nr:hypothetical protein [Alphaproteobacteria bacterium]